MFYELEGVENVRELGGLARPDGRRVRERMLFRTGHLGNASAQAIQTLEQWGVSLVVDMRDERERRRSPDKTVAGAENVWLPPAADLKTLFSGFPNIPSEVHTAFHDFYRYLSLAPDAIEAYAGFFRRLIAAEGRPVLWHCTQGKDRTGVGTMLLLSALGFDRETVMEEYLLTNQFAARQMEGLRLARASEEEIALMGEIFPVFEENARHWFDCIDIEYGSVQTYLELALGVTPEDVAKLEDWYLE